MSESDRSDSSRIWRETEADAWFSRNRATLDAWRPAGDPLVQLVDRYGLRPTSILEVGSSNGFRVAHLAEVYGVAPDRAVGVDPSAEAVADGLQRFPGVTLHRGLAHEIPEKGSFHVVVVNYVLTWIPRELLLASVAEVDRRLEDGGYLLLGDFLPPTPTRVPYHHRPDEGIFTWKQDYGALFQNTGLYRLVARQEVAHPGQEPAVVDEPGDRGAVWLLRKGLQAGYAEGGVPGR